MSVEIERKFLVRGDDWRMGAVSTLCRQGYLSSGPGRTVRVRVAGEHATLTIKGPPRGIARPEFEYEIPVAEANELLDTLCEQPLIEKIRHVVAYDGFAWEIDEFQGDNAGLVVAEVELEREHQDVSLPPWVGEEVTGDPRYYNASLVRNPYSRWGALTG
jgi:adenylate cyclase